MKFIWLLTAAGASALAAPAVAQSSSYGERYEAQNGDPGQDLERQIQRLDDQINASDRQGHISPSEADMLVRELRDVETQLLDIRSRTFHASQNWTAPRSPSDDNSERARDRGDDSGSGYQSPPDPRADSPGRF